MNIGKINSVNQNISTFKSNEKSNKTNYENPVSRSTEKNLAILKTVGTASVVGAIVGGLTSCLGLGNAAESSFLKRNKIAVLAGIAATAITTAITLPANVYNTKVSAFAKQKEMDVFSRDRSLKSNLTEEVDKEVQDEEVSLDKKLDDNLKLQMANKGTAIGIANVTAQPQG